MRSLGLLSCICAFWAAGCCHVNRLAGRSSPIRSVDLAIRAEPQMALHFTRKMRMRQTRKLIGPLMRSNRSVLRYQELVQELGGPRLQQHLRDRIARALRRQLGLASGGSDEEDAELTIVVAEMVFTAADHISPLTVTWRLELEMRDAGRGETIWRDCPEWPQDLGAINLDQLLGMGPEGRDRFLDELAHGLADRLVRSLIEDGIRPQPEEP